MASLSPEFSKGVAAFARRDFDAAWEWLARLSPGRGTEYEKALPYLWKICLQRNDTEGALTYLRSAAINFDTLEAHWEMGELLLEQRRVEEAVPCYERVIERHPGYTDAFIRLGAIHLERKQLDKAVGYLDRAISLDPKALAARWALAQACCLVGDRKRAQAQLVVACLIDPGFLPARKLMADLHLSMGDHRQAVVEYCKVVEADRQDAGVFLRLAKALHALGDLDQALAAMEHGFRLQPRMVLAGFQAAKHREARGHPRAALELYDLLAEAPEEHRRVAAGLREQLIQRLPEDQRKATVKVPYRPGEAFDPDRVFAPLAATQGFEARTPPAAPSAGRLRDSRRTQPLETSFMANVQAMESWFSMGEPTEAIAAARLASRPDRTAPIR